MTLKPVSASSTVTGTLTTFSHRKETPPPETRTAETGVASMVCGPTVSTAATAPRPAVRVTARIPERNRCLMRTPKGYFGEVGILDSVYDTYLIVSNLTIDPSWFDRT